MNKFKVGDTVKVINNGAAYVGSQGEVVADLQYISLIDPSYNNKVVIHFGPKIGATVVSIEDLERIE